MGIFDKAKDLIQGNEDKAGAGIDKAGQMINERTGGQHAEHIDKVSNLAKDQLGVPRQDGPVESPAEVGADTPVDDQGAPLEGVSTDSPAQIGADTPVDDQGAPLDGVSTDSPARIGADTPMDDQGAPLDENQ